MTRYLFLLALLPGCGLVRAVDQQARDAAQDAAIADNAVGVGEAKRDTATNTTAILDLRDQHAETPEEHAEIARLRAENDDHIADITKKLRTAEAVAAEKAQQAQTAEAAIHAADENAWWRIALEVALALAGVAGAGGLALRWRGLAERTLQALTEIGEAGIAKYLSARAPHIIPSLSDEQRKADSDAARDLLTEDYLKINDKYRIQPAVLKALGKEPK